MDSARPPTGRRRPLAAGACGTRTPRQATALPAERAPAAPERLSTVAAPSTPSPPPQGSRLASSSACAPLPDWLDGEDGEKVPPLVVPALAGRSSRGMTA